MHESSEEILTPDDISKILEEIDREEKRDRFKRKDSHKVVLYDFQTTNKLSKNQIRTLELIHEGFARSSGTSLSASLGGALVTFGFLNIKQITFKEYLDTLKEPANLVIFGIKPLKGKGILEISNRLGFLLIDKVLGGKGDKIPENREMSSLEQTILMRITKRLFRTLQESWSIIIKCQIEGEMVEGKPQFIQFITPSDIVMVISFMVDIDGFQDTIKLCLPFTTIEPIAFKLDTSNVMNKQAESESEIALYRSRLEKQIESVDLPVLVVLDEVKLKLSQILEMEPNDVIPLGKTLSDPVSIKIGKGFKFSGSIHKKDGRYAIRIIDRIGGGKRK